jgi:GTP cyclohydrolase I
MNSAETSGPRTGRSAAAQVVDQLPQDLGPKGVGVVIEAEHLCMSMRGVRDAGSRTVISALHGLLRDDARSRQELFALTGTFRV